MVTLCDGSLHDISNNRCRYLPVLTTVIVYSIIGTMYTIGSRHRLDKTRVVSVNLNCDL